MREMNLFTSKYSTQGKQSQGWLDGKWKGNVKSLAFKIYG